MSSLDQHTTRPWFPCHCGRSHRAPHKLHAERSSNALCEPASDENIHAPRSSNVNRTPTRTACTDAHSVSQHILNRMNTFHHANTRGSRLHIFVSPNSCHPRVMSRPLTHLTLTTSTSSLSPTVEAPFQESPEIRFRSQTDS